jgi:signal transduction histidine kinase
LLNSSVESLKQTVEDLAEVVKVNLAIEESQQIQLSKVIEKNIKSLSSQIHKAGIKIINEIPDAVYTQGISAYVDSIVLNMITNAIKYKSDDRASFLRIYCEEDTSTTTLFFQDNGLGIDLNKYGDKLFGMYKTFHRHDDSRGIGLFITKNQLESMGGTIKVESEVNIGTTFKIIFKK